MLKITFSSFNITPDILSYLTHFMGISQKTLPPEERLFSQGQYEN